MLLWVNQPIIMVTRVDLPIIMVTRVNSLMLEAI